MPTLNDSSRAFRLLAVFAIASAIALPIGAQQSSPAENPDSAPVAVSQQPPSAVENHPLSQPKEGFWGRINPFASKKWVKRQTSPISDQLTELDGVNARNAQDIKDVDGRAQAGISKAQSSADAANQTASAANAQAQNASGTAQQASGHVNQLNSTIGGLDQYRQVNDINLEFHAINPALTDDARTQLDQLAASLTGRQGYILEMEAHAPGAGSIGIENSQRLAESVERYLVTEHQIPVFRMHFVALGNAQAPSADNQKPAPMKNGSVHLRLMQNSLAAQADASPQSASATGTK